MFGITHHPELLTDNPIFWIFFFYERNALEKEYPTNPGPPKDFIQGWDVAERPTPINSISFSGKGFNDYRIDYYTLLGSLDVLQFAFSHNVVL